MKDEKLDLTLEGQLCFPLYAGAKEVVRVYQPQLDALGLTYTQYIVMLVLWEHRQLNVKSIGQQVYLDSGTLTPLLRKLEAKGLVTRERSLQDERTVVVTLTTKGKSLKKQARQLPNRLEEILGLSKEEQVQLSTLLNKVLDNLSHS